MTMTKKGIYTGIKSKFIKEKIKNANWKKDRQYIDDLIFIERYVLGGSFGMYTGYLINSLQEKYPKEWKIIYEELDPKEYKEVLAYEKKEALKERKEEEEFDREEKLQKQEDKKDWVKAGGKAK